MSPLSTLCLYWYLRPVNLLIKIILLFLWIYNHQSNKASSKRNAGGLKYTLVHLFFEEILSLDDGSELPLFLLVLQLRVRLLEVHDEVIERLQNFHHWQIHLRGLFSSQINQTPESTVTFQYFKTF